MLHFYNVKTISNCLPARQTPLDARNASKEGVGDSTLITFTISDSVISIICFSKEDATPFLRKVGSTAIWVMSPDFGEKTQYPDKTESTIAPNVTKSSPALLIDSMSFCQDGVKSWNDWADKISSDFSATMEHLAGLSDRWLTTSFFF